MTRPRTADQLRERLHQSYEVTADGCWEWRGKISRDGYGRFSIASKWKLAHRAAFELIVGPIPLGLELDHLCRNRPCVRPEHLEPVTRRENLLRGNTVPARRAAQTHCLRNHEFTPQNTYISGRGERCCRECINIRARARRARLRGEAA